tara:strand:+ start:221 stop:832 length:612 start_codon:yes stop_codon:yes gene_type:complete
MNKLWFFGDSFCHPCSDDALPIWWGTLLSNKINKEIRLISSGGCSITETVVKLNNNYQYIKPNDTVIISYTTPYRFYFDNMSVSFIGDEIYNPQHYTKRQLDAIKLYMLELYTEHHQEAQWVTYVSYMQNQIVPALEENNVEVKQFYSFEKHNVYSPMPLLDLPEAEKWVLEKGDESILKTHGHFGNDEVGNFNLEWAEHIYE